MSFFKRLFGKKETSAPVETSTLVDTPASTPEQAAKPAPANVSSEGVPDEITQAINFTVDYLNKVWPIMGLDKSPIPNHPANLDFYMGQWQAMNMNSFMGLDRDQHSMVLACNFGQYLVDQHGFKWCQKDGTTVVGLKDFYVYPLNEVEAGIKNRSQTMFVKLEEDILALLK